jgi:hypothetical protein
VACANTGKPVIAMSPLHARVKRHCGNDVAAELSAVNFHLGNMMMTTVDLLIGDVLSQPYLSEPQVEKPTFNTHTTTP